MKKLIIFTLLVIGLQAQSQEIKCKVTVNATSVRGSNKQMFKTLERAVEEFVNRNRWTDKRFQNHERIKADIFINVKEYDAQKAVIKSELYFRSYRPTYNSDYQTLLLNLIDKNFTFSYREFEKLDFNLELFDSNLTSTLAFYVYVALGTDFNSFKEGAGKEFYEKAEIIQTNADQSGINGWDRNNKNNSKGDLIEQLLNEESTFFHKAIYTYHRWGLDLMADKPALGKNNTITAFNYIKKFNEHNKNASFLTKIFFDSKSDEIVQIFTSGPPVNTTYVVTKLRDLASNYDFKWDEIDKKGKGFSRGKPGGQGPPRGKISSDEQREMKMDARKKER